MIVRTATEIYLDANATTPVLPEAAEEAHEAMKELFGNPSSSHTSGLRARFILESARDLARQVLGAADGQIVFTSGATEAIQMAIFSTLCTIREKRSSANISPSKEKRTLQKRTLLYGATEHKAIPQAIKHWNKLLGVDNEVLEIPVDPSGQPDLNFLRDHAANADLICTMAVNNETGVVADLGAIEKTIRGVNPTAAWLVDSVQAIGKLKLNLSETTIDYAPISGHKIYAPKGIGLLYVRENAPLIPLLAGGGQEQGARGGTENLPGVAALAAIMRKLAESETFTFGDEAVLIGYRERIVASLRKAFPLIVFNAPFENSVPTTINFAVKGFPSKEILDLFDAAGMRVSSGSACGSAVQGSYVLEAMGIPRWQSDGAIRLSFGPLATEYEIDAACSRIEEAGKALCESCLVVPTDIDADASRELDGLIQLKSGSMCTWLLMDSKTKRSIIIDPFDELAERAESLIRCQKSRLVAILDTHAHVDHDSCRTMLLKILDDHATEQAKTDDLLGWPEQADGVATLDDGSEWPYLRFSEELVIVQIDLPGHTQIGRTFLVGQLTKSSENEDAALCLSGENIRYAFTGDTILMGGIGRTDFPCSTIEGMYQSLQWLPKIIRPETLICPTHDYNLEFTTTLAAECSENDFLRSVVDPDSPMPLEQFVTEKPKIDAGIADATNTELVCGLIRTTDSTCELAIELGDGDLKSFFREHQDALVIDVREPHEFSFEQDWSALGFDSPPENIPLTRLAGALPNLLIESGGSNQDVIFLCRTGRRSGKAAEVARRIGITGARHIAGGIALNGTQPCVESDMMDAGYMI